MRNTDKTTSAVITLALIGVLGFVAYLMVNGVSYLTAKLDYDTYGVPLAMVVVILVSAAILARSLAAIGKHSVVAAQRSERAQLYERLLHRLSDRGVPDAADSSKLDRLLLLGARKGVLDAYVKLRRHTPLTGSADPETHKTLKRLISEMRRDLGHQDLPFNLSNAVALLLEESPMPRRDPASDERAIVSFR